MTSLRGGFSECNYVASFLAGWGVAAALTGVGAGVGLAVTSVALQLYCSAKDNANA